MYLTIGGNFVKAKQMGKGRFSKVYEVESDPDHVYIVSNDWAKHMLTDTWARRGESAHLPEIEKAGTLEGKKDDYTIFKMKRYSPLTAKHKEAWKVYRQLVKIADEIFRANSWQYRRELDKIAHLIASDERLPENIREALQFLLFYATNYHENYYLDLTKSNFSVDENGVLILRDVVYFPSLIFNLVRTTI